MDIESTTCPVLASYVLALNDGLSDDERQRLKPILPRLIGTRTTDKEIMQRRASIAVDAAIHIFLPDALDAAADALKERNISYHPKTLRIHAKTLRELPSCRPADAAYAARAAASDASNASDAAVADTTPAIINAARYASDTAYYAAHAAHAAARYAASYASGYATACAAACAAADAACTAKVATKHVVTKVIVVLERMIEAR